MYKDSHAREPEPPERFAEVTFDLAIAALHSPLGVIIWSEPTSSA